jgi:hypothetical protein
MVSRPFNVRKFQYVIFPHSGWPDSRFQGRTPWWHHLCREAQSPDPEEYLALSLFVEMWSKHDVTNTDEFFFFPINDRPRD